MGSLWRKLQGKGGYTSRSQVEDRMHGEMDRYGELGRGGHPTGRFLPGSEIAPHMQMQAERAAFERNEGLMREAFGTLRGGLNEMGTYRPGGLSAMQSPYYSNMAQTLLAGREEAPDLMHEVRKDAARKARKAAGKAGALSFAGKAIGTIAAIAAAPVTGGASLMALPATLGQFGQAPGSGAPAGDGLGQLGPGVGFPEVNFDKGGSGQPGGFQTGGGFGGDGAPGQQQGGQDGGGFQTGGGFGGGPGPQMGGPGNQDVGTGSGGAGGVGGGPGSAGGVGGGVSGGEGGAAGPAVGGGGVDLGAEAFTSMGAAATIGARTGIPSDTIAAMAYEASGGIEDTFWDSMIDRLDDLMQADRIMDAGAAYG